LIKIGYNIQSQAVKKVVQAAFSMAEKREALTADIQEAGY